MEGGEDRGRGGKGGFCHLCPGVAPGAHLEMTLPTVPGWGAGHSLRGDVTRRGACPPTCKHSRATRLYNSLACVFPFVDKTHLCA